MRTRLVAQWVTLRTTILLLYRSDPRAFIISAIASLTEPLFYPALLILLQLLFSRLTASGSVQLTTDILPIGIGLVLILLIQRTGIIVRDASSTVLRQEAWVVISKQIMEKLPSVPYSLFEDNAFQARYGLVVREASYRSITLVDTILSTAPILLGLIGLALTLFTIAPLMVLILLVIAIPAGRIEQRFSGEMYDLQERTAPHKLRLEALTNMQIDAIWQRDVRIYGSNLLRREHSVLAESFLKELKTITWRFFRLRIGASLVQVAGMALALLAAFALLQQGQLSVANVAVLLPGTSLLGGMISAFTWQFRSLLESLAYAQTLSEFLATSFEQEGSHSPAGSALHTPNNLTAIHLKNVSYTYPQQERIALTDISYSFTPGMTAIVGTNGAGKTTLVKLISGLVTPTAGEITAEAKDGSTSPLSACVKSVLFQDPGHFPFSIRHNITMQFDAEMGEEERIAEALRGAGLWEVVQGLPDGIDTVVGAGFGGVTDLSGGQWQRLALARLLYHDAPIIILDEPSASLDPVGERQIFSLLSSLAHEKIILFTTHRYDTIRKADTIVVLVDGQIAEVGTHEELEQKAGAFWSLYLGQGTVKQTG
ncbi:MAG: ATP-binding cassette domain-containing protein [Anaerolineaceae bacterium]|nr:ATP-binding cassette domain-containing protein [Anaerolineaceae bacterium]